MKYGYVVFDMDGTLIDTCEAIQQSLRDTIVMLTGKTPAKAEMRATFGTPSDVGLKMLGVRDEDIQRGILLWSENIKKYEDTPRAFPGVRELMDGLKAGGCRIGIATSKNAAELEHSREQFGDIVSRVDCIICADDTAEHKPEPGPLLKYMERTGAKPSEVLYVSIQCTTCSAPGERAQISPLRAGAIRTAGWMRITTSRRLWRCWKKLR